MPTSIIVLSHKVIRELTNKNRMKISLGFSIYHSQFFLLVLNVLLGLLLYSCPHNIFYISANDVLSLSSSWSRTVYVFSCYCYSFSVCRFAPCCRNCCSVKVLVAFLCVFMFSLFLLPFLLLVNPEPAIL